MVNFFWLHIKKCGGQSMRRALGNSYIEMNRKNPRPFISLPRSKWNDAINNYRIPLGEYDFKRLLFAKKFLYEEKEFNNMFKFTIVRNPYDRAVSSWLYCTKNDLKWRVFNFISRKKSFQFFLESLEEIWLKKSDRHTATHTTPIIPDITDNNGELLVDFVGKLENIEEDFKYICKNINIPYSSYPTINSNRETRKYRKFYNEHSKKIVEKYYKKDINFFNYKF